jgi:YXWGXW repeat-containing protein
MGRRFIYANKLAFLMIAPGNVKDPFDSGEDSAMRKMILIPTLLLGLAAALAPGASYGQVAVGVGISVHIAPPAIPVYVQPPCPTEGYLWTPGYWAYGDDGYYWVPGVWVAPPRVGLLWTPGYWGWGGGVYAFHAGYWGPHIGFYGGVNYGFGYGGVGFVGGEWRGGHFAYNTAVVNVNTTVIHNTYVNKTVVVNNTTRTSFNGGPGGINARANERELAASRETHVEATHEQRSHETSARSDKSNFYSQNHGKPANAAMSRVGERQARQQQRIGNGVKNGQLTPHETAHLENKEAKINKEVHNDRKANGGTLTPAEKKQVNHQQNQVSKDIAKDKHNNKTDKPVQKSNSEHPHK